ncbi:MAG: amidohydrolase family protein [Propionibacteriales bacterium]|nr:amidohydrolase family protein [Propionibacteriales bacterium]
MSQPASGTSSDRVVAIDVHAHVIPPCVPAPDSPWGWQGNPVTRHADGQLEITTNVGRMPIGWTEESEDVDLRLRHMDKAGVDMQVISLMPTLWMYGVDGHDSEAAARQSNDDLIRVAEEHPSRFRVFAHLPLDRPEAAIAELERVMSHDLVVGAAVGTNVAGKNWDEPELQPVLDTADRLGALLFFHPMAVRFQPHMRRYHLRNLIGNPAETTLAIADLVFGGALDRLPGLRMVFAHGGGYACFAAGRFDHGHRVRTEAREHIQILPSEALTRLYFDNLLHSDHATRFLVDTVGSSRVVLGTDYPADMGPTDPVYPLLNSPVFDETEKRAILGENLLGLLGLDRADVGAVARTAESGG